MKSPSEAEKNRMEILMERIGNPLPTTKFRWKINREVGAYDFDEPEEKEEEVK